MNSIEKFQDLRELAKDFHDAYVVIWLYDDLLVTKLDLDFFHEDKLNLRDVVRFRIFNESGEIHGWRSGNTLRYRIWLAAEQAEPKPIKSTMLVVGKIVMQIKKAESRFAEMKNIAIQTENKVEYNEIGQVGYTDSRFVKFVNLRN